MIEQELWQPEGWAAYEPENQVRVSEHEANGEQYRSYTYVPEHPTSEVPVVYAWGFGTSHSVVSEFADNLASQGRTVTIIDEPDAGWGPPASPKGELARNSQLIAATIDQLEYDQVDIVAHSMGAITSRGADSLIPGRIRSVLDISPAGQDGVDAAMRQNLGGAIESLRVVTSPLRKSTYRGLGRMTMHAIRNLPATLRQQKEILEADTRDETARMKDAGIRMGLLAMHADALYRPQEVAGESVFERYDSVASFRRPMAGHNEIFSNSEEVAVAVQQQLADLNNEPSQIELGDISSFPKNRERLRATIASRVASVALSKGRKNP